MRVSEMLPAGFGGDGRFGTLIFESYGAAACDNEIPREGVLCLSKFRCKRPLRHTILYSHYGFRLFW